MCVHLNRNSHVQTKKVPEVLAGFFSRTHSDEKAEIKWPLEPWSADPEQVMQESIHIRTEAKKTDFPVVVMENLKLLCE